MVLEHGFGDDKEFLHVAESKSNIKIVELKIADEIYADLIH